MVNVIETQQVEQQDDDQQEEPPSISIQHNGDEEETSQHFQLKQDATLRSKQLIKLTLIQSILYTVSLILIYLFQILGAIVLVTNPTSDRKWITYQRKLNLIFQPLQGFMNLIIFVWSKVASRRLYRPELSVRSVLCDLFPGCSCRIVKENNDSHSDGQSSSSSVSIIDFDPDAWDSFAVFQNMSTVEGSGNENPNSSGLNGTSLPNASAAKISGNSGLSYVEGGNDLDFRDNVNDNNGEMRFHHISKMKRGGGLWSNDSTVKGSGNENRKMSSELNDISFANDSFKNFSSGRFQGPNSTWKESQSCCTAPAPTTLGLGEATRRLLLSPSTVPPTRPSTRRRSTGAESRRTWPWWKPCMGKAGA